MGGNAFDSTRRLSEAEYARICGEIQRILLESADAGDIPRCECRFPPEIADKARVAMEMKGQADPYGDVDAVLAFVDGQEHDPKDVVDAVNEGLGGAERPKRCGKTHSVVTAERYQVDLLFCRADNLDFLVAVKSNNDFLAFFGHLLRRFRLKVTEKGLTFVHEFTVERKRGGSEARKADVVLTRDRERICEFVGLESRCFDGRTRLTVGESFEALMRSRVYFHRDEEFGEKYKAREEKKGRAMIAKMFGLMSEYDGRFEADKDEEHPARRAFARYANDGDAVELGRFVLGLFGKSEEAEAAEKRARGRARGFDFAKMSEMFPGRLEAGKKVAEVMKSLRRRLGSVDPRGETSELEAWFGDKEEDYVREVVGEVLEEVEEKSQG